ncbi:fructosamine kinase family protein [Ekhidna sp.]
MNEFIHEILAKHLSHSENTLSISSVSGGCINNAYKIEIKDSSLFLKWNREELNDMFATESKGLDILNTESKLQSPEVIGQGIIEGKSYLLTNWIDKGAQASNFWKDFGVNLAFQHKKSAAHFGLDHNNFIGSLRQSNKQHIRWSEFFINERLIPQLNLASKKQLVPTDLLSQFELLYGRLEDLVPDEKPSLLHGDLWSGNFMIEKSGFAAIFDPSVHYGHRETELSFTKLFGGFSPEFYDCYHEAFPLESGFDERVDIHNLYPLLVHVNLFGSSYLSGIINTLKRYT